MATRTKEHPVKESWRRALIEAGYTFERREDRWGETKSGWWCDDVFLGETVEDAYRTAEIQEQ